MSTLTDKSPWPTSALASSKSLRHVRSVEALAPGLAAAVPEAGSADEPGAHAPHTKSDSAPNARHHAFAPATLPFIPD